MFDGWSLLDTLCLSLASFFLGWSFFKFRRSGSFPPGPKGLPIIGNVWSMPTEFQWETFSKWNERWGDIVSVDLLGQRLVILNSVQHTLDLLEKRAAIYADRPTLVFAGEFVGWNRSTILFQYGPQLRRHRRFLHQEIGSPKDVEKYGYAVESNVGCFLLRLLSPYPDLSILIQKTVGASNLQFTYGYRPKDDEDEMLALVESVSRNFSEASTPGAYLVDIFPIFKYVPKWMPGAGWKKKAEVWAKNFDDMYDIPFKYVKKEMSSGVIAPCILSQLLEKSISSEEELEMRDAAATIYSAGADITKSVLSAFFLAMTNYQEVQLKAQREIDTIIGREQIPTFMDSPRLPYITALFLEVLRWGCAAPLGMAHRASQDDLYAGYFIPKDSLVIANVHGIMHDPTIYEDPMEFRPERFLPSDTRQPEQDPRELMFGFGRRRCPGIHLAEATITHYFAAVLSVFNIAPLNVDGKPVKPNIAFGSGTIRFPLPFECSIQPRSPADEASIRALFEAK